MTQAQKAARYDSLVREGDVIQREISKLKSNNLGFNPGPEYDKELSILNGKLKYLQEELNKLF